MHSGLLASGHGLNRRFAGKEKCPHIRQLMRVIVPERAQLAFDIDQFDAMGQVRVNVFDMSEPGLTAWQIACVHMMHEHLLDAFAVRRFEHVRGHTRTGKSPPEALVFDRFAVTEVQAQGNQLGHW
jgi:hypothetical protein